MLARTVQDDSLNATICYGPSSRMSVLRLVTGSWVRTQVWLIPKRPAMRVVWIALTTGFKNACKSSHESYALVLEC